MITQFNCYSVWEQDLECAQANVKQSQVDEVILQNGLAVAIKLASA